MWVAAEVRGIGRQQLVSQDSTEGEELDAFQGYFNKPMLFLFAFRYRIMPDTPDSHHWAHEDTLSGSNSPFY